MVMKKHFSQQKSKVRFIESAPKVMSPLLIVYLFVLQWTHTPVFSTEVEE